MKKLLLLIIGMVLFVSVSAQSQFFSMEKVTICNFDNAKEITDCNTSFDNSLFEFSDGFRYITRYAEETEVFKVTNAYKITDGNIYRIDCYDMNTLEQFIMLLDYDLNNLYVEKKLFTNKSLNFTWIRSWEK